MAFKFEKIDACKRALKVATDIEYLISKRGSAVNRSFIDQLSRASYTISLNIAEQWRRVWDSKGAVYFSSKGASGAF